MTCEFSDPVNYLGEEPLEGESFNFKTLTCETEEFVNYYENGSTGANFWLDERISYGDIFLMIIVSIVLTYVIAEKIGKFVFRK